MDWLKFFGINKERHVPVYIVFGPQGSGKTTQGKILAKRLAVPYYEAGETLRELAKAGTPLAEQLQAIMQSGQLVTDEILRQTFINFMAKNDCSRGLVIDGFPRNSNQVQRMEKLAEDNGWQVRAIHINLSDESAKERLAKRFKIVDGKKVFRQDDKPEIVEKRLATYRRETGPIIQYFRSHDELIEIDGRPTVEEVSKLIDQAINERYKQG